MCFWRWGGGGGWRMKAEFDSAAGVAPLGTRWEARLHSKISRSRDKKMTRMVMMLGSGWWPSWPLKPGGNTAAAAATAADRTLRAHPGIRRDGRSTMRTSGWFRSCTVPGCPCAWAWRPPLPGPCPGSRCPCTGLPQLEFRNDAVCLGVGKDWEGREISWNILWCLLNVMLLIRSPRSNRTQLTL